MDNSESNGGGNGFDKSIFVRMATDRLFKRNQESEEQTDVMITTREHEEKHVTEINWEDRNYPKFLKLVHYNIDDLDEKDKKTMRYVHRASFVFLVPFAINILTTIILAANGIDPVDVVYSLLNLVIFVPLIFGNFYYCYLFFALGTERWKISYLVLQSLLSILFLVAAIASFGSFNGCVKLANLQNMVDIRETPISEGMRLYLMIFGSIETIFFFFSCASGVCLLVNVILKIWKDKSAVKVPSPSNVAF